MVEDAGGASGMSMDMNRLEEAWARRFEVDVKARAVLCERTAATIAREENFILMFAKVVVIMGRYCEVKRNVLVLDDSSSLRNKCSVFHHDIIRMRGDEAAGNRRASARLSVVTD